jgi:hypothetical protein
MATGTTRSLHLKKQLLALQEAIETRCRKVKGFLKRRHEVVHWTCGDPVFPPVGSHFSGILLINSDDDVFPRFAQGPVLKTCDSVDDVSMQMPVSCFRTL